MPLEPRFLLRSVHVKPAMPMLSPDRVPTSLADVRLSLMPVMPELLNPAQPRLDAIVSGDQLKAILTTINAELARYNSPVNADLLGNRYLRRTELNGSVVLEIEAPIYTVGRSARFTFAASAR